VAPANCSILQAFVHAGETLVEGVGCMGQGVCGSCRVMIRRSGEQEVKTALACETVVEDGMQVAFLDYFTPLVRQHVYRIEDIKDSWQALRTISEIFPEASHCRHCSGCDRACPKGLDVQRGVNRAVDGKLAAASQVFDECVMCNLCTLACPEHIQPNHLGLFVRRMIAGLSLRPANLMRRLQQIESGEMKIDFDAPGAQPPR
jgi:succinate dehydrogenase/fumarate reductase-like Fe-S protein